MAKHNPVWKRPKRNQDFKMIKGFRFTRLRATFTSEQVASSEAAKLKRAGFRVRKLTAGRGKWVIYFRGSDRRGDVYSAFGTKCLCTPNGLCGMGLD